MKKNLALILALIFVLMSFVACKNEEQTTSDTETGSIVEEENLEPKNIVLSKNGQSVYTVVTPQNASENLKTAANTLISKLSKETRTIVKIIDDWTKDGVPADSENEIIIGNCMRIDSQKALDGMAYNDYKIAVTEKNIVIASRSEEVTIDAIWDFISLFTKENIVADSENNTVSLIWNSDIHKIQETQKMESFTLGGKSVENFRIVYPSAGKEATIYKRYAEELLNWIGNKTGYVLEAVPDSEPATEYEILIGKTSRKESNTYYSQHNLDNLQYSFGLKDRKMHIAGAMPFSTQKAIELFERYVEQNKGKIVNFDTGIKDLNQIFRRNIADYRLMQYNILNSAKGWGSGAGTLIASEVEIRREILAAMILGYSPDIVALSECFEDWHEGIRPLIEKEYTFVEPDYKKKNGNRSPLLYKTERFDLIESGVESIDTYASANNRCVTWAVLEDKVTKDRLSVFGTHYIPDGGATGEQGRTVQAQMTLDLIDNVVSQYGGSIVLMGDLNTMKGADRTAYSLIANQYEDVFGDMNILDHIFYDPSQIEVAQRRYETERYAEFVSDHRPLITDVFVKMEPQEMRTFKISENLNTIKVIGRSTVNSNGITADWTAGGIEFFARGNGPVWVTAVLDSNVPIQFRVYVNGVEMGDIYFTASNTAVKLPGTDYLDKGLNIRLVRIPYVKDGLITLSEIRFAGMLTEYTDDKQLIEFVGDSITCGFGSVTDDGFKDGTKTYAYEAANELGADYSMVAISGIGVGQSTDQHEGNTMDDFYKYTNYYRNSSELYAPTKKASLVVVNLNTNDHNYGYNNSAIDKVQFEATYKANLRALIADIRNVHGANVNIVWCIGTMIDSNATVNSWLEDVLVDELGGTSAGIYIMTTSRYNDGGAGHPSYAGHQVIAEELVTFINQNNLLNS